MKIKVIRSYFGRMKGLLGTDEQELDFDALHLIPCKGIHTFGMKYALDIAFVNRKGRVIAVRKNVVPNRVITSPPETQSVVERPASIKSWLALDDFVKIDER
jgi:uncharacterized membrane protein (UPF0127 family)